MAKMSDKYINIEVIEYEYFNASAIADNYASITLKGIVDNGYDLPTSVNNLGYLSNSSWSVKRTYSGRAKLANISLHTQGDFGFFLATESRTMGHTVYDDISDVLDELINNSIFEIKASDIAFNSGITSNHNYIYLIIINEEQYVYMSCDTRGNLVNITRLACYGVVYATKNNVIQHIPTSKSMVAQDWNNNFKSRSVYLTPCIYYKTYDYHKFEFNIEMMIFTNATNNNETELYTYNAFLNPDDSKELPFEKKDDNENTYTQEDGGFPNNNFYNDNIDIPTIPNIELSGIGSNLYLLGNATLESLTNFIWNTDISSQLKKWFSNPSDTILSLTLVRSPITIIGNSAIYFGNVDSNIFADTISNWGELDCGTISIPPFYDNYLDTSPYTRYELYLPFYNFIDIPDYYVRDCQLTVKYLIDYLSMSALIIVASTKKGITTIINNITCNIGMSIPLTVADKKGIVDILSSTLTTATTLNPCVIGATAVASTIKAGFENDTISHVGTLNNASALLSYPKPYLKITRAIECSAPQFNKYQGLPTWNTSKLNDFKGFTKVNSVKESINFINEYMANELISILKSGIII